MFKSGFVAIIGRPNVGKSTLLNTIIGEKIAAVTAKPQTTRNRITGIYTDDEAQIIFIDTPGIYPAGSLLNRYLLDNVLGAFSLAEIVILMLDAEKWLNNTTDTESITFLSRLPRLPIIAVINKIDKIPQTSLLPLLEKVHFATASLPIEAIIPISALKNKGTTAIIKKLKELLPIGEACFPEEQFTEKSERFITQEMIREKIFLNIHQEVPYSIAVTIERFERNEVKGLLVISAIVHVEKNSQKGIVIGKGGIMLKRIGSAARKDLERLLGARIFLEISVRVQKDWTQNPNFLKEFGICE